jgi:hypothetical protein
MIHRRVNIACSLEESPGVETRSAACRSDMTVSVRQRYPGNGLNMLGCALKKYFEASALLPSQEEGRIQNALFCPVGGTGGGTPVIEAALEQIGGAAAIFVAEETGDIHISWTEKLVLAV